MNRSSYRVGQPRLRKKILLVTGIVLLLLLVPLAFFASGKVREIGQQIIPSVASQHCPPACPGLKPVATPTPIPSIKTVFLILMENHDWSEVKGPQAPYITNTLLAMGAHAEQYYNPPHNHPSLPNYLWLEAGTNFGITDDNDPSANHQSSTQHLVTLLQKKGTPWKAYEEDISGEECPLANNGDYGVRHDPFVYFDDVTNGNDSQSQYCIQHVRPYTELEGDLQANRVSGYNFITPNTCHDTHDCSMTTGDTWLSQEVPKILNSQAYRNGGAVVITWDEGGEGSGSDESAGSDGPIGLIVLSPYAKHGYENQIHYTHSSTLRTMQEIFGVTPLLGDAANATDLSDLFTIPLNREH